MSEQVPAEAVKAAQEAISQALAEDWHETWLESDDALARTALEAGAPFIRADEKERIAQLAADHNATYLVPCDEDDQQRSLHTHHERRVADLIRKQP